MHPPSPSLSMDKCTLYIQDPYFINPMTTNSSRILHCKKRLAILPSPARMSLTKLSLAPGIIKFFPARDSLVSDIPAGDGKIAKLFFTVYWGGACGMEESGLVLDFPLYILPPWMN
jgi:hypothetical protein